MRTPLQAERFTLTGQSLFATEVQLNGVNLTVGANDSLPKLPGIATEPGVLEFAPVSITFLNFPGANNNACK